MVLKNLKLKRAKISKYKGTYFYSTCIQPYISNLYIYQQETTILITEELNDKRHKRGPIQLACVSSAYSIIKSTMASGQNLNRTIFK